MKINTILLAAASALMVFTSCDSYLDKMPDDRAEVNSLEKVQKLLTTAYPEVSTDLGMEMSSDNITDNGSQYSAEPIQQQYYLWQPVDVTGNDSPKTIWESGYKVVGEANVALESLNQLPQSALARALRAEALLCRAYAMFQMANFFCMAWNPSKANEYMGLPYPKVPGVEPDGRGTLAQLYANINADIEEALPLLDDAYLTVPKYHFNSKAAYAFAARFNLFYLNFDKAIAYATTVLGSDPTALLRDYSAYVPLAGVDDIKNRYVQSSEKANLLLVTAYSIAGRAVSSGRYGRYAHSHALLTYETMWCAMPWNATNGIQNNTLYIARKLYGNSYLTYFPKMLEFFEYTDKVAGTGYPHIVDAVFTTDETLLVRAEAYALKKDYANALNDMNMWISTHCAQRQGTGVRPTLTEASVNDFVSNAKGVAADETQDKKRGFKKPISPQGFTIEAGTQTNLLYLILHMRRIETLHQGQRFIDIKRYGIQFSHVVDGESQPRLFKAGDLRGAIQLPSEVIQNGLQANPR